jgi:phytoene/squalene synthetase
MHDIMQGRNAAMERAVNDAEPIRKPLSAEVLTGMAAALGIDLSAERAATLVTQAEPHFALLRALDDVADPTSEPAAEFRLDAWTSRGDDDD